MITQIIIHWLEWQIVISKRRNGYFTAGYFSNHKRFVRKVEWLLEFAYKDWKKEYLENTKENDYYEYKIIPSNV